MKKKQITERRRRRPLFGTHLYKYNNNIIGIISFTKIRSRRRRNSSDQTLVHKPTTNIYDRMPQLPYCTRRDRIIIIVRRSSSIISKLIHSVLHNRNRRCSSCSCRKNKIHDNNTTSFLTDCRSRRIFPEGLFGQVLRRYFEH